MKPLQLIKSLLTACFFSPFDILVIFFIFLAFMELYDMTCQYPKKHKVVFFCKQHFNLHTVNSLCN